MLKLLILEDEEKIRKGIALKMTRLFNDVEIVGEAANGEEGLSKLESLKPDVVITDIKMPVIDGIHFIELALEINPALRFLIISGYEDFKFAQQAVRLGVSDYLLKPVNNEELKKSMENIRRQIEEDKERMSYMESLKANAAESVLLKKNKLFSSLLTNHATDTQKFINNMDQYGYRLHLPLFTAVQVRTIENANDAVSGKDKLLIKLAIADILEKTLDDKIVSIAHESQTLEPYTAVLVNHYSGIATLAGYFKKAVETIKSQLHVYAYMGIGKSYDSLAFFNQSYKEASLSADQKMVLREKDIIYFDDYEKVRANNYSLGTDDRRKLSYLFHTENIKEAEMLIKIVFEDMEKKKVNFQSCKTMCTEIFLLILNEIKEKNQYLFKDLFENNLEDYFSECVFLNDFQKKIEEIIARMGMFLTHDNQTTGKKIVGEIKTLMEIDYYKDLKLNQMAARYYINPSYLSALFLQETGKNFSQYLTDIRIAKAKEFLVTTKLSSAKIAEYIGYNDRSYFISVFQKAVGVPPSIYRAENRRPD